MSNNERQLILGRRGFLGAAIATSAVATTIGQSRPAAASTTVRNAAAPTPAAPFNHPGVLHGRTDLDRMKDAVAAQAGPIYAGYLVLAADGDSQHTYAIRNTGQVDTWGRGPSDNWQEAIHDSNAAYQNALMWSVTGDLRHADKARDILDVWARTLVGITGADGQLGAGLQGMKFVAAAEIIRHTGYPGWFEGDIRACEESFKRVWYRALSGHTLFANGSWDTAALQVLIAVAVFCDDRTMFEEAVRYAINASGDGSVPHEVVTFAGQGQESGRDQAHSQLGLGLLANVAEIAWLQGVDVYGYRDNLLLAGFEYTAAYNLGDDTLPFVPDLDRTGKYLKKAFGPNGRGQFQPFYEQVYAHYNSRRGLATPNVAKVVFRGPDGSRFIEGYNADHPGFGTFTHAQPATTPTATGLPPGAVAGLLGTFTQKTGVALSWAGSVEPFGGVTPTAYRVWRAPAAAGPYSAVTKVTGTAYLDRSAARSGKTYNYKVTALNGALEGMPSLPLTLSAGLPEDWKAQDIGDTRFAGRTDYDGRIVTVEAGGADIASGSDQFRYTYAKLKGDGTITARVVYPLSSQYASVGVMMRDGLTPESAHASTMIQGLPLHTWSGVWSVRQVAGGETSRTGSTPVPPTQQTAISVEAGFPISNLGSLPQSASPLGAPYAEAASDGYRLRNPYWVRIQRRGSTLTGSLSPDGQEWTVVGTSTVRLKHATLVGLAVCSTLGVPEPYAESTAAAFDNVTVSGTTVGGTTMLATRPAAPTGALEAHAGLSAVRLSWSHLDMSGVYTVKRAAGPTGRFTTIAKGVRPVGFGVLACHDDATGEPGTEYSYVVSQTNVAGEGLHSNIASAVMPVPPAPTSSDATVLATTSMPFEYRVKANSSPTRYAASGLPSGLALDPTTGLVSGVPTASGVSEVSVTAVNASGRTTSALTVDVGTPLPRPWSFRDIGDYVVDESRLGSFSVATIRTPGVTRFDPATGRFTLQGTGSDLNLIGQGMCAHVATQRWQGNGAITARVVSRQNAGATDQIGLVMTKSDNPFDVMAGAILTSTDIATMGVQRFIRRQKVAGGYEQTDGTKSAAVPVWLRLARSGSFFSAFTSADGLSWAALGTTIEIPRFGDAEFNVGLVVCSHSSFLLNRTVFDNVAVART